MPKFTPSAFLWFLLAFVTACSSASKTLRKPGRNIFITPLNYSSWNNDQLKLAVKDNIDVAGVVTTAGSKYLADRARPATTDAACLELARQRGVLIVGKTNLSEFAVSPSGVNEYFGTPRNPLGFWRNRIPGGSSSGSAVAVAKDFADVALGTDTAGSIRIPAACCGVVGLKTTHGLISLQGVHPIEPEHLDTVGPLAKNISNTVIGMDLLQRDFLERYIAAVALQPTGRSIRVGRLRLKGTDPKIDAAIDLALLKAGFVSVPLDPELSAKWEQAKADGTALAAAGAWISDNKFQSALGVSLRTKVVILAGRLAYNTKYQSALARRADWQAALDRAFEKVDVIALPTLQHVPFNLPSKLDAGLLEAQMLQASNTVPINYAGNPALAQPIPLRNAGFPVTSLQLIGPKFGEAKLLNAGRVVEETSYPSRHEEPDTTLSHLPHEIACRSISRIEPWGLSGL
jgi:Asp-tRNA(Asn)/Glu-tRNA(Gln) amidotransferase A subunit family amidase